MNTITQDPSVILESDVANATPTTTAVFEYQQPVQQDLQNTQHYYTRMVDGLIVDSFMM